MKKSDLWAVCKLAKQLFILGVLLFVVSWIYSAVGDKRYAERIYVPLETAYPVVAFGDSLVEGLGSEHMQGFVGILSESLDVPIYNAGTRRDKTVDLVERVERDVLVWQPRVVIMVVGGNDIIRRVPRAETVANLETLFKLFQDRGIRVVFGDVTQTASFLPEQNLDVKDLASAYNVLYVGDILGDVFWDPDKKFDLLHPNDTGYQAIAGALEPYVRQALLETEVPSKGEVSVEQPIIESSYEQDSTI
jgi:acyl-CoA thioesterase I